MRSAPDTHHLSQVNAIDYAAITCEYCLHDIGPVMLYKANEPEHEPEHERERYANAEANLHLRLAVWLQAVCRVHFPHVRCATSTIPNLIH